MIKISSVHNPRIKHLLSLSKSASRKKENLFFIEGLREIARAYDKNIDIATIFYCPEVTSDDARSFMRDQKKTQDIIEVTPEIYSKITYRENVDGLVVIARQWNAGLENIKLSAEPLLLIIESVEKPGNLGAILRTADAAAVDAVIICDPQTDIFNPNVIRSSIGCLFSNQVSVTDSESALVYLREREIKIFSAALQDAVPYTEADYRGKAALVFGSEADGLSEIWRTNADRIIKIPMHGIADSLNVSVSAAVITFEAVRQRK